MNPNSPRLPLRALVVALVITQLVAPLAFGQTSVAKTAPALSAARSVSVFLATVNTASASVSEERRSTACFTDSPR